MVLNVPCLVVMIVYYTHKTKRKTSVKKMLRPIKKNILTGETLKRYTDVEIDLVKEDEINK